MEILKALRLLGDESRVRILRLVQNEALSVAELQEILGMGQSRISMQLSQLKAAGFLEVRRVGQKSLYSLSSPPEAEVVLAEVLVRSGAEIRESAHDDQGLELVLARRKDNLRAHFDQLAGRFGRDYVPGRSWRALSELFLQLLPPLVIADLGAGEGTLSLLMAPGARRVIAVDNSQKMAEYASGLAAKSGIENLDYRLGDLEALPIEDGEVDFVLMHQTLHHASHPEKAVKEAFRVLKPGGSIAVLDLLKHDFEAARELYADIWLGFSQVELLAMLRNVGFAGQAASVVDREDTAPYFQSLFAFARKPVEE